MFSLLTQQLPGYLTSDQVFSDTVEAREHQRGRESIRANEIRELLSLLGMADDR
jgi:hypothetical protein